MAVRYDVTVDGTLSPRIITVLSPSTDISVQDLHDTLRDFEDSFLGMTYESIVSSGGKETLDAQGTKVGITTTLLNAKLAFEARPGPAFVQCIVSGGNLVSLDTNDLPVEPIQTTAYTQVVRTSSSSATLVEQGVVQQSSFNDYVLVDAVNGSPGTDFPAGTVSQSVDNLDDALVIAAVRGFSTLKFHSDYNFINTDDISNFTIIGEGPPLTHFTFAAGCITDDLSMEGCSASGTITSLSQMHEVHFDGIIITDTPTTDLTLHGCVFEKNGAAIALTLSSSFDAEIQVIDCVSGVPGTDTPILDFNGATCDVFVRNYAGGLEYRNITQGQDISIDMLSGHVILDSTVTSAVITVRGIAKLTDNSSATVDSANLIQSIDISSLNAATLELVKAHFNKMITDPDTGVITIYDDDNVTPLRSGDLKEDKAGTQPYRGQGAERRERMT